MEIKVIKEKVGYSAIIEQFGIFTQGDDFEQLTKNLKEALELYYENETSSLDVNKKALGYNLKIKYPI